MSKLSIKIYDKYDDLYYPNLIFKKFFIQHFRFLADNPFYNCNQYTDLFCNVLSELLHYYRDKHRLSINYSCHYKRFKVVTMTIIHICRKYPSSVIDLNLQRAAWWVFWKKRETLIFTYETTEFKKRFVWYLVCV